VIYTPPLATVLEGITRDSIAKLAVESGIRFEEQMITRDQLYTAEEVFISGTAAEVVGVRSVDTRIVGNGKVGPVTTALLDAFLKTVHGEGKYSVEWLDYVH
jgi:branched-chain amino acid aminotransferase